MIEVEHQIRAVDRAVGSRRHHDAEMRVVQIAQTFDATADKLWDACTNPERIPRWFLPVSGDLRLGGRYQLEGNAGGTIERCDPPRSFGATWEYGGGISWIEVRVVPQDADRTRFELDHISEVEDTMWDEFGPGAVGVGWDMLLIGLALHLRSGGERVDPAEAAAWFGTDDGKRFLTTSSDEWFRANVAAGADETAARGAADRTTAAYTAAPA